MKNQKDKIVDLRLVIRVIYCAFFIALFVITVLIWLSAPVQRHFKNIGKKDVWFGNDWYYTDLQDAQGDAADAIYSFDIVARIKFVVEHMHDLCQSCLVHIFPALGLEWYHGLHHQAF